MSGSSSKFGVGPFAVRIDAEPAALGDSATALIGGAPPPRGGRPLRCRIRREAPGRFILETGSMVPYVTRDPRDLAPVLQGRLLVSLLRHSRGRLVLHAASLARPGRGGGVGLLVAGRSGAGKSTAALALCRSGWRFLGDDMALLDVGRGLLSGTDLSLCLKGRVPAALRPLGAGWVERLVRFRARRGAIRGVRALRPPPDRAGSGGRPVRLRAVAFLRRGPPGIVPLTAGQALARLWQLRLDVPRVPLPCGPAALGRLLARVAVAEISTERPEQVRPVIERWLRGARG